MKFPVRTRIGVVLGVFTALYVTLAVVSYTRESATWDEPQHLTAGYAALTRLDFRIDPEHPPLVRMWAALPLALSRGIRFDEGGHYWRNGPQWYFCHQFMYRDNDADRMLYRARFMIVLLGVLLGVLLFCWAHELFGFWPATAALALYCFEPNLLAHGRLVTTDFGLVCFSFGAVYFLWRLTRHFSLGNVAAMTVFFVLAQTTKFSAVLLWPIFGALLVLVAVLARRYLASLGIAVLLGVASYVGIWAAYGFRFRVTATPPPAFAFEFEKDPRVRRATPRLCELAHWITARRLLPQAYAQGFLLGQAKAQERAGYLCGRYSTRGWWYYFPVAFLIKTPLAVLAVFFVGVGICLWRWRYDWLFALVPVVVFLGAGMAANINIGLRHVLTIYPFVLLVGAAALARLRWARRVAPYVAAAELSLVYPHCIAAFNLIVGGPSHGHKYLVDSNLDWGQDLKGLKRWMDKHGVGMVNLSYFGTADPAYYGIRCQYLPGGPFFADGLVGPPRLPGYVAVSVTNLRGVYFTEEFRRYYGRLLEHEPVARIGHSIHVYWMERPWW
ncbi:MAG: glycosyltransferase family 39 protein [Verrucomicrobiae bacterium]|nr:glycosyltransferase family 39 protein [Verrucomicrobiae bacterium]